jgi:hypothetical protein
MNEPELWLHVEETDSDWLALRLVRARAGNTK